MQAWAAIDTAATGVMQTDEQVRQLVSSLPAPLFRTEEQMEGSKLRDIAGTHSYQTTSSACFCFSIMRPRCSPCSLFAVGSIATRSRPYGFNTIIINLSCEAFGLNYAEVASRVPLPRRGAQARPARTSALPAPLSQDDGQDGAEAARFVNPMAGNDNPVLDRE